MIGQMPDPCENLADVFRTIELIERTNAENPKANLTYEIICGPEDLTVEGERMILVTGHPAALGFIKWKQGRNAQAVGTFEQLCRQSPSEIPADLAKGETSRPVDGTVPSPPPPTSVFEALFAGTRIMGANPFEDS